MGANNVSFTSTCAQYSVLSTENNGYICEFTTDIKL